MFSFRGSQTIPTRVQKILKDLQELGPVTSIDDSRTLHGQLQELCESTKDSYARTFVLNYLAEALDPKSDWRIIENGLRILGALALAGSHEIFQEISRGLHIDVTQRTLILTTYSHDDDRITRLIRTSALVAQKKLIERTSQRIFVPIKANDEFGLEEDEDRHQTSETVSRSPVMTPDTSPVDLIDL